jgi:cytochrome b561
VERTRYVLVHRLLHWLIAVFVLALLVVGLTFMTLGYEGTVEAFGNDMTNSLYTYHKTFGILVLALMLFRVLLRWAFPPPPYPVALTPFEQVASRTVHGLFYLLLIVMPMIGWAATAAGGFPVQFFDLKLPGLIAKDKELSQTLFQLHGAIGLLLIALIGLHVAGALRHWRRKDGVMRRISLP